MFKSLKEIVVVLRDIHYAVRALTRVFKDWEASCMEEVEQGGGIVPARSLKPGWMVDGKKIVVVTPSSSDRCYDRDSGYIYVRFSGVSELETFRPDSLVLVDKEEQQ